MRHSLKLKTEEVLQRAKRCYKMKLETDLTVGEIGKILGIPTSTVTHYIIAYRRKLREDHECQLNTQSV